MDRSLYRTFAFKFGLNVNVELFSSRVIMRPVLHSIYVDVTTGRDFFLCYAASGRQLVFVCSLCPAHLPNPLQMMPLVTRSETLLSIFAADLVLMLSHPEAHVAF
jgi:hypothetical protein